MPAMAFFATSVLAFSDRTWNFEDWLRHDKAEYLTQIFGLPQVNNPRLRAVVWFNLQDNSGWPAGLLREDLTPKPSLSSFLEATASGPRGLE